MNREHGTEISSWLEKNKRTLKDRAPHEIAYLAVTCGFDVNDVCEVLSHWTIDAQTHTTQKVRIDWVIGRELTYIEERGGKISLMPQWMALNRKVSLGRDFDE